MKGRKYTRAGMLFYFLKGSFLLFAAGIAANLLHTLFSALVPQLISLTVDCVIGSGEATAMQTFVARLFGGLEFLRAHFYVTALSLAALAVLIAVTLFFRTYFIERANQKLLETMRRSLFSHIQRLPLGWRRANMTGDIIQRCTSDADTLSNFISRQLVDLLRALFLTAVSLTLMFLMSVRLALIAAAFLPVIVLYSALFYRKAGRAFLKCDENEGILSAMAQENFSGARVVRAFGAERREREKFEKQNNYYTGLWVRVQKYLAVYWTTSDFLISLQLLVILAAGTVFCLNGQISAGDLIAFVSYNVMLSDPVRQLGRIISGLSKAGVSIDRIAAVMSEEEEEYGTAGPLSGEIEFRNVTFRYGDKTALRDVSFVLPEGSTLGILGGTGSGKSTLAALLCGLFPLSEGEILIGGKPIGDYSLATLRKNIGLVLQEGQLYSRTVGENIAIAAEGATREDVERVARLACLHENVCAFANGYDTVVGERGVTLSGGQKQRVAIARTLLRGTPYLIFDDSLSAVDTETDAAIRAELFRTKGTRILISHRVTTVMEADNILVMDGGKVVEQGAHGELLQQNGLYSKIFGLQTAFPEEEEGTP